MRRSARPSSSATLALLLGLADDCQTASGMPAAVNDTRLCQLSMQSCSNTV